jgi:hypothetical protein
MNVDQINAALGVINLVVWVAFAVILGRRVDHAHSRADIAAARISRLEASLSEGVQREGDGK